MIVFALDDDAFEADIKSVEDIFRIRVQAPRRSVQLRFKKSMLGTPIVRQAVSSPWRAHISNEGITLQDFSLLLSTARHGQRDDADFSSLCYSPRDGQRTGRYVYNRYQRRLNLWTLIFS